MTQSEQLGLFRIRLFRLPPSGRPPPAPMLLVYPFADLPGSFPPPRSIGHPHSLLPRRGLVHDGEWVVATYDATELLLERFRHLPRLVDVFLRNLGKLGDPTPDEVPLRVVVSPLLRH